MKPQSRLSWRFLMCLICLICMLRKLFITLLLLCVLIFISLLVLRFAFFTPIQANQNNNQTTTQIIRIQVKSGSSHNTLANQLVNQGLAHDIWTTKLAMKLLNLKPKAGVYAIEPPTTPWQVLKKLQSGTIEMARITFIEGWSVKQMRQAIARHDGFSQHTEQMSNNDLLTQLRPKIGNTTITHLEGLFMPDTYLFAQGSGELAVLRQAHQLLLQTLQSEWEKRAPNLPLKTPYEALILASIIEKETGTKSDRPMIAAVFINRLKIGMRLQTDPTVIYGLGEQFDGNLRKKDLEADTRYNTYTRSGLPPTPIALPSRESIFAALHPAQSNALYFVARGDGSSHFSQTLSEHNSAVKRYQLKQ